MLEHDAAAAFAVALAKQGQRQLDALAVILGRLDQFLEREGLRRDDEQRLHRAGELVDRGRGDQAERAVSVH